MKKKEGKEERKRRNKRKDEKGEAMERKKGRVKTKRMEEISESIKTVAIETK